MVIKRVGGGYKSGNREPLRVQWQGSRREARSEVEAKETERIMQIQVVWFGLAGVLNLRQEC